MFYQLSGQPVAQSGWHIKSPIPGSLWERRRQEQTWDYIFWSRLDWTQRQTQSGDQYVKTYQGSQELTFWAQEIKLWEEWAKHWRRTKESHSGIITFHNYSLLTRLLPISTCAPVIGLQSKSSHISRPSTPVPCTPAKLVLLFPSSSTSFLLQDPSTLFPVSGNWHPGFFHQINP